MKILKIDVPVASFRPPRACELLETSLFPPPSTLYGSLCSFIGETNTETGKDGKERRVVRHRGVRFGIFLLGNPSKSMVIRSGWKEKASWFGEHADQNICPQQQQVMTDCEYVVFVDSSDEKNEGPKMEERIEIGLDPKRRGSIKRFGGVSMGESKFLVSSIKELNDKDVAEINGKLEEVRLSGGKPRGESDKNRESCRAFVKVKRGRESVAVSGIPDYKECLTTRWAAGEIKPVVLIETPKPDEMFQVA